jgi:hypothetical protein
MRRGAPGITARSSVGRPTSPVKGVSRHLKMLPSGLPRAICDVTYDGPRAGGGLHDESRDEVGDPPGRLPARPPGARADRGTILDEFCETTGYHGKYALRLLNGPPPGSARPRRRRRPATYGLVVNQALTAIWEAAGFPWSVRLQALLPLWLPWARRRLRLSPPSASSCRPSAPARSTAAWPRSSAD